MLHLRLTKSYPQKQKIENTEIFYFLFFFQRVQSTPVCPMVSKIAPEAYPTHTHQSSRSTIILD